MTFGNLRLITISGVAFQDTNGSGARNNGEAGLPGLTIFLDTNRNGILDAGEVRTITNANGNYTFANLVPGTYRVLEVARLGWVQTTNNPSLVVARSGTTITTQALAG